MIALQDFRCIAEEPEMFDQILADLGFRLDAGAIRSRAAVLGGQRGIECRQLRLVFRDEQMPPAFRCKFRDDFAEESVDTLHHGEFLGGLFIQGFHGC